MSSTSQSQKLNKHCVCWLSCCTRSLQMQHNKFFIRATFRHLHWERVEEFHFKIITNPRKENENNENIALCTATFSCKWNIWATDVKSDKFHCGIYDKTWLETTSNWLRITLHETTCNSGLIFSFYSPRPTIPSLPLAKTTTFPGQYNVLQF